MLLLASFFLRFSIKNHLSIVHQRGGAFFQDPNCADDEKSIITFIFARNPKPQEFLPYKQSDLFIFVKFTKNV
jgi:hypothetical protein